MSRLSGRCLCGDVAFELEGPVQGVGQCHCSLCRRVSGTSGNAVFLVPIAKFRWTAGEHSTVRFALPSHWSVTRCQRCGSPLPASHDGKQFWVPAGLMNEPLGTKVKLHIHTASRADWDEIPQGVAQFEAFPPGRSGPS
jgi:hypothetical protein